LVLALRRAAVAALALGWWGGFALSGAGLVSLPDGDEAVAFEGFDAEAAG
jgi:hypothetical protein